MFPINPLVAGLGSPPIPEARTWLSRYDGARGPAIDLSQAVPGYPPAPELLERLGAAAGSSDAARYGAITGDSPLRESYASHVSDLFRATIRAEDIAITAGCNLAFAATMLMLARAGDAVLLPTPWYFNYEMSLGMLRVEPRALPCLPGNGFVPDPADAEPLLDERVRAIVLLTPNNPTGAIYPASVIERFAQLCRSRGIWLVIDETYRDFLTPSLNVPHELFSGEAWRDHVVGLYSFSKGYAIPGHRVGAMIADKATIEQITKILDCLQICAPRPTQVALAWAIAGLSDWRSRNRVDIQRRGELFKSTMSGLPGWEIDAIGAYFAYLRHPCPGESARSVAERLAVERGILALPGSAFGPGQENYLRVSFPNIGPEVLTMLRERLAGFGPT